MCRARVSNPTRDQNKVLRWYPGRGRLMASPTSPGMFYTTKVRASIAWWLQPAQYTPLKVLQYLQHSVKIEFDRPMKPLSLAPRLITEPRDIDFALKDLVKGRACGAYIDLAASGAAFLSRSRVHTVASGKQRMVHALCGLNEATTKRPCRYEMVRDLPSVLRWSEICLPSCVTTTGCSPWTRRPRFGQCPFTTPVASSCPATTPCLSSTTSTAS